ncbi:hypothetical protein [Pseudomonas phage D6]|nr:hypothetical protein [Pseudomonas phage D6]
MSDKKLVMLDTRHQVKVILDYLSHYHQHQPLVGIVQPTKVMALNMVQSIVAEIMEFKDKSLHVNATDWDVVRASILFGLTPGQVLHRQVKFIERIFKHDVINTIFDDIKHQINAHEKYSSYNTWEVINTGSAIVLAEIGDRRLLHWEMLQDAQEDQYITLDLSRVYEEFQKEFEKNFGPYPASQLWAMIVKAVMDMFPQLHRIDKFQEQINYDMAAAYGIPDLTKWLDQYLREVFKTFNIASFGQYICDGAKHDCNFTESQLSLTIVADKEEKVEVDTDAELAKQLMRGDYLPEADRIRAEKYLLENM